ncbi:DUF937 domain-containing protein [Nonomuraea phyllanthi]|uniref:DUF937 domain-containing protein n=1 Tax=Nonomuraea phyllanthi TaxID=2219224 RepID=A0A5C4VLX2_9ACTN|nr:DUF937 domain-containing protein [Nonomuraea phyllanthi]KAB8189368.1 DUF937 domain-containing protein [Nonomuraea phyllanthi]QFY11717.1 DUF937 domain-containing protein [Nonomuraea phyllanthi]
MTLNDELLAELGDSGLEQIAGMLGTDTATARDVVTAVAGAIVGGLARNAQRADGAEALRGALDEHVDTDPFTGDVASLTRDGHGILHHVLGGHGTEQAATGLSRFAGVDASTIMRLMPLIAPMVMSLLANRAEAHGMDADDMADDLDRERAAVPGELGDLLEGLLSAIFGEAVPEQGGPYEPGARAGRPRPPDGHATPDGHELAPGNPDW